MRMRTRTTPMSHHTKLHRTQTTSNFVASIASLCTGMHSLVFAMCMHVWSCSEGNMSGLHDQGTWGIEVGWVERVL